MINCNNSALFSVQPTVSIQGSPGSQTGTLSFATASFQNGACSCSVVLSDSYGLTYTLPVTIVLTPVNHNPTFVVPSSYSSIEDAGAILAPSFATSISKGPFNEQYKTISFSLTAANPSLFSVQPTMDSATGNLAYTAGVALFGSSSITATLSDNQGGSSSQTFTVYVLFKNHAPSFTLSTLNLVDLENAGSVVVSGFASNLSPRPANEASQTLSWSFSVSNAALFVVGSGGSIFTIDASGNLRYTVQTNIAGTPTISITLSDNGGTTNGGVNSTTTTINYALSFVNYPPSFVPGNGVSVNEDSGATTFTSWATSINPGKSDEASQVLQFTVTFDTTLLSTVTLSATTGTLVVTPLAATFGVTTMNATLCDNLGACVSHTATITVIHVNHPPTFTILQNPTVIENDGIVSIVGPANEIPLDTPSFVVSVRSATVNGVSSLVSTILDTTTHSPLPPCPSRSLLFFLNFFFR